jgi:DNA-binding GntR family transcriptional regulator
MTRGLRPISRSESVRSRVYSELRRGIIQGTLPEGSPLVSTELSAQLGVSRTPVREAIVRLVHDGLAVETEAGQVVVRPVTREELRSFFEIRAELERLAARRAVERLDQAWLAHLERSEEQLEAAVEEGASAARQVELNETFHRLLYERSGNALLARAIHDLEAITARRLISRLYERADPQTTIREHRAIVAAVAAGDAAAAAREAGAHVERAGDYLIGFLDELEEDAGEPPDG